MSSLIRDLRHRRVPCVTLAMLCFASPSRLFGQQDTAFSGYRWSVRGDAKLADHMGERALLVRGVWAELEDVEFENGTIEFDLASVGQRSFVGIAFHVQDGRADYENYYLRPHQTGRFDAMQYTPVFNNVSAWQLYPEYNGAFAMPHGRWMHVRLEVKGHRLTVYLDRQSEPALEIERLEGGWRGGRVAITAGFPGADEHPDLYPTAYANFEIHPEPFSDAEPSTADASAEESAGLVDRWALSPAFVAHAVPVEALPPMPLEGWDVVPTEPSGRLNIARHRAVPAGASRGSILARLVIRSDRSQVKKLNFGFSDQVSVFVNREIVFSGNNTYRSRSQRYLGVMTLENDALYLPLRAGTNELLFVVSESFGGWGLVARFADASGISIEAAAPPDS